MMRSTWKAASRMTAIPKYVNAVSLHNIAAHIKTENDRGWVLLILFEFIHLQYTTRAEMQKIELRGSALPTEEPH
jgi:hypothetical protein